MFYTADSDFTVDFKNQFMCKNCVVMIEKKNIQNLTFTLVETNNTNVSTIY